MFQHVHMSAMRDQTLTSLMEDTVNSTAGSRYIRQILSAICYLHAHRWENQLLEDGQHMQNRIDPCGANEPLGPTT